MPKNKPLIDQIRAQALKYASIGIAVYPLEKYAKHTYKDGGWKNGTCSVSEVEELFSNSENITGLCIIPEKSSINIVAIDVDEHTGSGKADLEKLENSIGALPREWMQETTSNGIRILLQTKHKIRKKIDLTENIELLAGRKCVAVAPSKAYKWQSPAEEKNKVPKEIGKYTVVNEKGDLPPMMPEAWENAILKLTQRQKTTDETAISGESIPREIKDLEGKIGNRHDTLKSYMASVFSRTSGKLSDDEYLLILKNANNVLSEPLPDEEFDKTMKPIIVWLRDKNDLSKFHLFNKNGDLSGVNDFAIFEHLCKIEKILVISGMPFIYENGKFVSDETGSILKTKIRSLIYPKLIRSTTIDRIFKLFISARELQSTYDCMNNYPSYWIPFQNGLYDPIKGAWNDYSPEYRCTYQIPHIYEGDKKPIGANSERFLQNCFPDKQEIETMFQYFGYCMTRDTRLQRFLILFGIGGTGKSTLIRVLESIVGAENISNISLHELSTRFASYGLVGKVVNACADLEINALEDTSMLKKILGEDSLRVEPKGKDAFSFKNMAKLIFSTNELPTVKSEKSNGFYRRLLILTMNNAPAEVDADLFNKLNKELDWWIDESVKALCRMYQAGYITESKTSKDAVEQLRCDSDSVEAFLRDCTTYDHGSRVKRISLFYAYEDYCRKQDRTPLKKKGFFQSMRVKGYPEFKTNGDNCFRGIKLEENALNDT